jgi:hypothetical protein
MQTFIDPLYLLTILKRYYGITPSLILAARLIVIHPHFFQSPEYQEQTTHSSAFFHASAGQLHTIRTLIFSFVPAQSTVLPLYKSEIKHTGSKAHSQFKPLSTDSLGLFCSTGQRFTH